MKPTDNLHQLIKSLTSSEKRYFKVHAKRHVVGTKNKYEQLFDVYDALPDEDYDERELKQKLQKKALGKNLADDKKNLQEMIMKAMLAFHAGHSVDNQLNELLAEEDFYRQKRLNDLRRKTISKAKELAEKYEKYTVLLTLIDREVRLKTEMNPNELIELAKTFEEEKASVLDKINTASLLRSVNSWFFIHFRVNANNTSREFWIEAESKLSHHIINQYTPGLSYTCDINFYKIWALYYQLKKDYHRHNEYSRKLYECYEKYPQHKENDRMQYKIAIYNYITSIFLIDDYESMRQILEYADSLKAIDEDEAGEDFQNITFYRQIYYMNTSQFVAAIKMADEINEGIKKYRKKVNKARELTMYNNIAISFLMIQRWSDVLTYTAKIISDKTDVRFDLKYKSMLFELLAHYELNNFDLLIYQIRNTERFLKKYNALQEPEIFFIGLLNQLLKHGKEYFKTHTQELEKSLPLLSARGELKVWLQSKLSRKPMHIVAAESH